MTSEPRDSTSKWQPPKRLVDALREAADGTKAAKAPQSILPENHVTRPDTTTSHLISQDYIVRFRHAGSRAGVGNNIQIWLGGALGAVAGAATTIIRYFRETPNPLVTSDFVNVLVFACFSAGTVALAMSIRKTETVDDICDEIEQRKTTKA